ncbi:MAG TPA: GNAT family N-acetyltransferase [Candidatus Avibacteroides excrementipullorum]|nr:GNAT family N-acetyltransferase [Candidatus Avibacteroides excrementipullorum]
MGKDRLVTKRLILRAWQESDAESLYKYAKDPAIGPIAGWPPHTSVEESLNVIRTVFAAPETYAVVLKETGEPVGSIGIMFGDGLHSAEMQPGEAEIGYWIGVPYWGQGLIPEAMRYLLKRCFEDLGMTAVWCGYYDGNTKSRRVMEKCGFRFHHTEEGKTSPLGDVRTEHFMRMTKEEWLKISKEN